MWIYYYVSKARIVQLAEQLFESIPVEELLKWNIKRTAKATAEAEASKLLQLLGAKAKVSLEAQGEAQRATEMKFMRSDEALVNRVHEELLRSHTFSELSPASVVADTRGLHDLVRFSGSFVPSLEGAGAERFAQYAEQNFIAWTGTCGEVPVQFVTSKGALVSQTPLLSFLTRQTGTLHLEGFATLLRSGPELPVALLPLFFGRKVSDG